jgi:uncharacterized protein (TIRG00374 family)
MARSRPGEITVERPRRLPRGQRPRLLLNLATIAVTIVFSYVALSDIDIARVGHALGTSDYVWLIPAVLTLALATVARAMRWRALFVPGRRPTRAAMLNATIVGYFYNSILPARAGEAARVVVLTRRSAAPPVEIVGTAVLERLYDVTAILVIFFAAEPWLPHVSWFGTAALAALSLAVLIAAASIALAVWGDRPLRFLLRPLGRFSIFSGERLDRTLEELVHGLSGLRHVTVAVEVFLWTSLAWMLSALCAYLVTLCFHLHLPFASGVLMAVVIGLGMILPAPPAAVGVFEGAALIALRAYDVPHSIALSCALLLHVVNFVPFVVAGVPLLHYNIRLSHDQAARTSAC